MISFKQLVQKIKERQHRKLMSKEKFKIGDQLYTVWGGEIIIPFVVDGLKVRFGKNIGEFMEYTCDWKKHGLPQSNHGWRFRRRHNHNLFKTKQQAEKYLKLIKIRKEHRKCQ